MRRLALRSALTVKATGDRIVVLDALAMEEPKTKEMISILGRLSIDSTALILLPEADAVVERSASNLPEVKVLRAHNLNVRDILGYDYLVVPVASLEVITGILG
jgi:large subunit ribosomal protein L4